MTLAYNDDQKRAGAPLFVFAILLVRLQVGWARSLLPAVPQVSLCPFHTIFAIFIGILFRLLHRGSRALHLVVQVKTQGFFFIFIIIPITILFQQVWYTVIVGIFEAAFPILSLRIF